jgi:hypothetical protein
MISCTKKLHSLYSSQNSVIRVFKSMIIRWPEHIAEHVRNKKCINNSFEKTLSEGTLRRSKRG